MIKSKLSSLVQNQFPDFYKEEGQNFLAFIEAYYEYLEQNGKLTDAIQNIQDYKDINTTLDEYLEYFQDTLLPSVPHDVLGDKRLMAKYVKNFNIARGTEASYKLMFRAIYNEDVEITYPADKMLKVSDGEWRQDRYLTTTYDTRAYDLIGKTIEGRYSGARGLVEDVIGRVVRNRDVMQILVSNIIGEFEHKEPIRLYGVEQTANSYTPFVESGIKTLSIVSAGGEYAEGDVLSLISDKNGDLGKVVVTGTVDLGGAITFNIEDGGSGYTSTTYGADQGQTQIFFEGGDGSSPASFDLQTPDIGDRFAIFQNTNLLGGESIFGTNAPSVLDANTGSMGIFANTLISSPNFGLQEQSETEQNQDFFTNANAVIQITQSTATAIPVGSSLYGSATSANAHVTEVIDSGNPKVLRVNTYKNFTSSIHNYFSDSEAIENGDHWVSSFSNISDPNIVVAPDGSQTAENLIEDGTQVSENSGVTHYLGVKSSAITHTTTDTWNFSCYARAISDPDASKRWLGFRGMGVGGNNKYPVFDVADGVIADYGDGTLWNNVQMEAVGGGWYRCSAAVQPTSATTGFRFTLLNVGNNDSNNSWKYNGDEKSGLSIWGAQQSLGSDLKMYQRTTAIGDNGQGDGEYIHLGTSEAAANVGIVSSFSANTIGHQVIQLGIVPGETVSEGDEIVSSTISPATYGDNGGPTGVKSFGVVKKILTTVSGGYTHYTTGNQGPTGPTEGRDLMTAVISANTSSSLVDTYWDAGPLAPFMEESGVAKVGNATVVANVATASYTANSNVENLYSRIGDSLIFKTANFGTIQNLSNRVGGSGFSVAPTITAIEPNISVLGIGEQYLTLESDVNLTPSSSLIDETDRVRQGDALGDVKRFEDSVQQSNGKWHTVVRVWQKPLQRDPGNITYANNANAFLDHVTGDYVSGQIDNRSIDSTTNVKIVKIVDKGVLGKNANINAKVGADGTATGFRVIDSGFSYEDNERVRVQESSRTNSTQAVVDLTLSGTANSEGYYATARSHVSSKRGFIQDSKYYQEFSYQVIAPLALKRYKEVALKLVHPAGQSLFGEYQLHSNVAIDVVSSRSNTKRIKAAGTVSISQNSSTITGSGTSFTTNFSAGGNMIVEISENNYISVPLNTITDNENATSKIQWTGTAISSANIYYTTGEIT